MGVQVQIPGDTETAQQWCAWEKTPDKEVPLKAEWEGGTCVRGTWRDNGARDRGPLWVSSMRGRVCVETWAGLGAGWQTISFQTGVCFNSHRTA